MNINMNISNGSFKNEESYVIYIGYRIIHISEEDYEMWDKYYWSEDNTIREMIKQIILEKYGHGRNDIKRNEIKCF